MSTRTRNKRQPFTDPLATVIEAAQQAQALRRQTYSLGLMQTISEHNKAAFMPALKAALGWANGIEKDTKQLEAKRRRAYLKNTKAGTHAKRSS